MKIDLDELTYGNAYEEAIIAISYAAIMKYECNETKAAKYLGVNRGALRMRMKRATPEMIEELNEKRIQFRIQKKADGLTRRLEKMRQQVLDDIEKKVAVTGYANV